MCLLKLHVNRKSVAIILFLLTAARVLFLNFFAPIKLHYTRRKSAAALLSSVGGALIPTRSGYHAAVLCFLAIVSFSPFAFCFVFPFREQQLLKLDAVFNLSGTL